MATELPAKEIVILRLCPIFFSIQHSEELKNEKKNVQLHRIYLRTAMVGCFEAH